MKKLTAPKLPTRTKIDPGSFATTPEGLIWKGRKTTTKKENLGVFQRQQYNVVVAGRSYLNVRRNLP